MNSILSTVIVRPTPDILIILKFCFVVSLFLVIPFLSIAIGSLVLSMWFGRKGAKDIPGHHEFAREILFKVLPDRHYGFVFGVIPLFTVLVVYAQTLYHAEIHVVGFFLASVLSAILGFYFLYKYRWSLRFDFFLDSAREALSSSNSPARSIGDDYASTNAYTRSITGGVALLFLLLSIYQLVGSMSTVLNPDLWASTKSSFFFVANIPFWWKFTFMMACSSAVTGAAILYFLLDKNGDLSDEAFRVGKSCGSVIGLYGCLLVPLIGLLYHWSLPGSAYSSNMFLYGVLGLVCLLIAAGNLASEARESDRRSGSSLAFVFVVLALCFNSIGDNISRENATASHTHKILFEEDGSVSKH